MKTLYSSCFFAMCLLLTVCHADQATAQVSPTATAQQAPAAATRTSHAILKLPNRFTAYTSESIDKHRLCVVGTITDEDSMNQKPVVYVAEATSKRVLWMTRLDLPADMYQSRATHCTRHGNALFVLLQSDTQSEQTLSQTLLRVVRLDAESGTVQLQRDVDVPTAYSAWVDEGSIHFQWNGDRLVITGNDKPDSDHDRHAIFTVKLNDDLKL